MHVVSKKRYQFEWKHLFGVTYPSKTYPRMYSLLCRDSDDGLVINLFGESDNLGD